MLQNVLATATFEEILDDLSSRFIINVPEVEVKSVERICFQVEQAHWFYEDFVRVLQPNLPSFQLKGFSAKTLFKHCPLLKQWAHDHDHSYANFMKYRKAIPVCGAILLNDALDKCILVKGWHARAGWGLPRGKINQNEDYDRCAIREVFEETGYDITDKLKQGLYLETTIGDQWVRLYIIIGVSEDTEFIPQTRKEISQVAWFDLDELPGFTTVRQPGRFYMVAHFLSMLKPRLAQLRKAHNARKGRANQRNTASQAKMVSNQPQAPAQEAEEPTVMLKSLLGIPSSPPEAVAPSHSEPAKVYSAAAESEQPTVMLKSLLGISSSSPVQPKSAPLPATTSHPKPSASSEVSDTSGDMLKTLLGISSPDPPPTQEDQAQEPSLMLKSLLGISSPPNQLHPSRSLPKTSMQRYPLDPNGAQYIAHRDDRLHFEQ